MIAVAAAGAGVCAAQCARRQPHTGVVLFPGCQLPLLLSTAHEQWLLERCMSAPPPLTRLLAVLPG